MSAERYPVEKIERYRIRFNAITKRSRIEYFVKWLDYGADENTWEPLCNLREYCSNLIHRYHSEHPEVGPSRIPEKARKSKNDNAVLNESLWPTTKEVFVFLSETFNNQPLVNVFHPTIKSTLKEGLNISIIFLESHAFAIIRTINMGELANMVYVGDVLNYFQDKESTETHGNLANNLLSIIGVDQAQIIIHQTQTRNDTCAYSAIAALQESVKLILKCDQIPGLITYPTSRVDEIMKN